MAKRFTLKELAKLTQSLLIGDETHIITDVNELSHASAAEASFLANSRYNDMMKSSQAGVICIDKKTKPLEGKNFLVCDNPSKAFQVIAKHVSEPTLASAFTGIHPSAVIAPNVHIGSSVTIAPNVTIDSGCFIDDNTTIHANVAIATGVHIGKNCTIYSNVAIREGCKIGNQVIVQSGAVIGSCGFGYLTNEKGEHIKLEQMGNVILEDDVEIGANSTIDRARFKSTVISKGTKIDNLVQIAHNVRLGEHNIIVAQTGIAGSSKTGRYVITGGQVGIVGHIEIGDGVQIATRGGVSKSLTKPGPYRGSPVMPLSEYNRYKVQLRNIDKYVKKIALLEKKLEEIEKNAPALQ